MELVAWGWTPALEGSFEAHRAAGRQPGRIVAEDRGRFVARTAAGEHPATVSGQFRFEAGEDSTAQPAVGDWVALDLRPEDGTIHALLPRRSVVSRRPPRDRAGGVQVLAANVDVLFVVMSLNRDFNLRRLERYLAVAWESGARPVVILSKADLAEDVEGLQLAAEAAAPGVPVMVVSAVDGTGPDGVRAFLGVGRTIAVIGSSGVGKSTLVNALAGSDLLDTGGVRLDDDRGRHTTTRRELVQIGDGLIIDTPGLREMGLADEDGLSGSFADVDELAASCRFSDCAHQTEPGCAVCAAVADGRLDRDRLASYGKLLREARYAERQTDVLARLAERNRWKAISRNVGRQMKLKYGEDQSWRSGTSFSAVRGRGR